MSRPAWQWRFWGWYLRRCMWLSRWVLPHAVVDVLLTVVGRWAAQWSPDADTRARARRLRGADGG